MELGSAAGVLDEGNIARLGLAQGTGVMDGEVAVALDGALHEFGQLA